VTALRFVGLWVSPALLLGVAANIYAGAPAGLALAFLVVLAPSMTLLEGHADSAGDSSLFTVALTVLAVILLLAANLLLLGDVATGLGAPRWHGIVVAAGAAFAVTVWPWADRWWPWLAPAALAPAALTLALVAHASGLSPAAAWSEVAARPDFRFTARSPWVASGGFFPTPGSLTFTEPHTVSAPGADVFAIITPDGAAPSVQEWRPSPGDAIMLRPGDRISYAAGARLKFESGRRAPGAPPSGVVWADSAARAPALRQLAAVLGLAITLIAGGLPLLRPWAPRSCGPAAAALALVLASLAWAEGWAVYAGALAPEFFLLDARGGLLVQLPVLVLDAPWGRWLGGVLTASLIALFVATASALRERVAALDRAGSDLGRDAALWAAMFGVAVVASLWPRDPWSVLLVAFGMLASSLGPLALAGDGLTPRAQALAGAAGLGVFALVALGGGVVAGTWAAPLVVYPALFGGPAAWAALSLARSRTA
jgi:hypothetical protein